jgi:hypothetical protein
MEIQMRGALAAAALMTIAGCSSATSPSVSPVNPAGQSGYGSAFVHRGVPLLPPVLHRAVGRSPQATYPTSGSLVFEGDQVNLAVGIYQTKALAKNPAPIASIAVSAGCPYGLARDGKGTIYVADNCGGNDVEEYPIGSTTMSLKITTGISNPLGLAIAKNGTLYVSNYPASITEYKLGATTPFKTITGGGLADPFGLALDAKGNLYIADFGANAVFELPKGGSTVTNLGLSGAGEPIGLAVDLAHNLLWETGGAGNTINVYQIGGSTTPIQTITGQGDPYAISLQNIGKPKGEVVASDVSTHKVYAYKPGKYTPYATLSNGVNLPTGLLITKP